MYIKQSGNYGNIYITGNAISNLVGIVVTHDGYGIVGMESQHAIKDSVNNLFKKPDMNKGIQVSKDKNGKLTINIYVIAEFGTKFTESAKSIQKDVQYKLKTLLNITNCNVNVIIQDVAIDHK